MGGGTRSRIQIDYSVLFRKRKQGHAAMRGDRELRSMACGGARLQGQMELGRKVKQRVVFTWQQERQVRLVTSSHSGTCRSEQTRSLRSTTRYT
jgi:hypothetical protein